MKTTVSRAWPAEGLTRVPYWVYQDPDNYQAELRRIFEGPTWSWVGIESDVPRPGDYRTAFVGEMPVIVVRGEDGAIRAFENRCAHRGALIAIDDCGSTGKRFQCVYHAWNYDLAGNLTGVAFEKGSHGKGGMPPDFRKAEHGPRKLRTATLDGLVFASLWPEAPPIEEYLGAEVRGRIARVLRRPVKVLGRFTQALPNNWKLYFENVKDTYHASLLHAFFTTFRITRLTQGGGVLVSPDGGHHASTTIDRPDDGERDAYRQQGLRADHDGLRLADPSLLDGVDEFGDGIKLQILTVFPGFVLQQIANSLALRQVLPKGPDRMELHWTYIGFADDTPEMLRCRQAGEPGRPGGLRLHGGRLRRRLRAARRRGGRRRPVRRQHGRGRRRVAGHAGDGGRRPRLLEGLPAVHGVLMAAADPTLAALQPLVAQLNADYARAIDDDRLEEWPEFFTDACFYSITSAENHRQGLPAGLMYADSKPMLRDRVAALREASVYERQSYRHLVGLPALLGETEAGVRADTPFLVVRIMRDGRMDLFATGRYLDVLVEESGALRFRERIVVCDSGRVDTLLAIPL